MAILRTYPGLVIGARVCEHWEADQVRGVVACRDLAPVRRPREVNGLEGDPRGRARIHWDVSGRRIGFTRVRTHQGIVIWTGVVEHGVALELPARPLEDQEFSDVVLHPDDLALGNFAVNNSGTKYYHGQKCERKGSVVTRHIHHACCCNPWPETSPSSAQG